MNNYNNNINLLKDLFLSYYKKNIKTEIKKTKIDHNQIVKIDGIKSHINFKMKKKSEFEAVVFDNHNGKITLDIYPKWKAITTNSGIVSHGYLCPDMKINKISLSSNETFIFLLYKSYVICNYNAFLRIQENNSIHYDLIKKEGKKFQTKFTIGDKKFDIFYYYYLTSTSIFILVENSTELNLNVEIVVIESKNLNINNTGSKRINPISSVVFEYSSIDNFSCFLDYKLKIKEVKM